MIGRRRTWLVVAALVAATVAGCSTAGTTAGSTTSTAMDHAMDPGMGSMSSTPAAPGTSASVDAGFAYDMGVHHQQAVAMAEVVAGRLTDPDLAIMARDIALTQQYQIGEMRGWLDVWGLPPTTTAAPMAWMGMSGPMPGLASDEELEQLQTAPPGQVDRLFLELMIRHHQGGLTMAHYARDHAESPFVRQFASSIADSQTAEIATMTEMLQRQPS